MLTLPRTVGSYTLHEKLGTGGIAESFLGQPTDGNGPRVVIRRVLPFVCADANRLAATEARVRDLMAIRHPFLVPVVDWLAVGRERFIVEEYVPGTPLSRVLDARRRLHAPLPANVFLNLATQICNGLEALHGRPGTASGVQQVLHLGLRPGAVLVNDDGKVVLGSYGLVRSPTLLPHGGVTAPSPGQLRYLAPEQTLSDAELSPASDIFSLGSILFELATSQVLFEAGSNLRTIHSVRRAEVSQQLEAVRERIPGLDRVLTRALAQNPRFRYHRAFVLREDLRGLMASYSFSTVAEDTRAVLESVRRASPSAPAQAESAFKAMAVAPEPHLSAGQSETLHAHQGLDAGLFEDTRHSSGPPPLVTDEVAIHKQPILPPELAPPPLLAPPPVPAAPPPADITAPNLAADLPFEAPSPYEPTVPDPIPQLHDGPPPRASSPTLSPYDDDLLDAPSFGPDPESEFAGVEMPWDDLTGPASAPEDLPGAREMPLQPAYTPPPPPAPDDGTAPFRNAADPPGLGPPPPLQLRDASGRAVHPNDTVFLPAPPAVPPPPVDSAAPEADEPWAAPLRAPLPPAPAAPASPEDTAFFAAPLPPPPPIDAAPAHPAPVASAPPPPMPAPPPNLAAVPEVPAALPPPPGIATAPPPLTSSAPEVQPASAPPPMEALPPPPSASPPVLSANPPPEDDLDPPDSGGGRGLLYLGIGMAALALLVCAGVGGFVATRSGPTTEPVVAAVAPAGDIATPAVADVAAPEPEATKAPEEPEEPAAFEARDTATPTPKPEAAPPPKSSSSSSRPRRPKPPRIPTPALPPPPPPKPAPSPEPAAESTPETREGPVDIDRAARTAASSGLDATTRRALEAVAIDDPEYTRSRVVLSVDAARRGDTSSAERYLEQTMALPENRYNPVLLSQIALYQVNRSRYAAALNNANKAEQHWARIPSAEMFERKAAIFEVQAAATQGLLYEAEDDRQQLELVNDALRRWTRFREHATSGSSADRVARADTQIEKLNSIRERLE